MRLTFRMTILGLVASLVVPMAMLSPPAHAAEATPLMTPEQEVRAKAFLLKKMPGTSDEQLTQMVRDPNFLKFVSTPIKVTVTPISPTVDANGNEPTPTADPAASAGVTAASVGCTWASKQVKVSGLFGTLFSYKVKLAWCYNYDVVFWPSPTLTPDLTSYGSYFGWSYRGFWQAKRSHFYTYNWHANCGYAIRVFPEFKRCLGGNIGCVDQRFLDVGVWGHYNGTYSTVGTVN